MELAKKWFAESAPQNAKSASVTIGSGDNGVVTITADLVGTEGNAYTVEVAVVEGNSLAMGATLTGTDIVVSLGTSAEGVLDNTKNTAVLIATAINALPGVSATKSGTGATAFTQAVSKTSLEGGQMGTYCPVPYTYLADDTYYYVNIAGNTERDANWRRFQLASY